jgi:ribosomal 30S subunit maturation factor RimM
VAKLKEMITKKGMTKTKKKASTFKEMITKKGRTNTKKRASKFKEMITRKVTTKTKKKMITMKGDDQNQEEDDYHGWGRIRP